MATAAYVFKEGVITWSYSENIVVTVMSVYEDMYHLVIKSNQNLNQISLENKGILILIIEDVDHHIDVRRISGCHSNQVILISVDMDTIIGQSCCHCFLEKLSALEERLEGQINCRYRRVTMRCERNAYTDIACGRIVAPCGIGYLSPFL